MKRTNGRIDRLSYRGLSSFSTLGTGGIKQWLMYLGVVHLFVFLFAVKCNWVDLLLLSLRSFLLILQFLWFVWY